MTPAVRDQLAVVDRIDHAYRAATTVDGWIEQLEAPCHNPSRNVPAPALICQMLSATIGCSPCCLMIALLTRGLLTYKFIFTVEGVRDACDRHLPGPAFKLAARLPEQLGHMLERLQDP
jgi:hypothetical protein